MNYKIKSVLFQILFLWQIGSLKSQTGTPCRYHDTVDLSNSQRFSNGSYLYQGILIPRKLVGLYNYEYVDGISVTVETDEPKHVRGCVCFIKNCLKLCCKSSQMMQDENCIEKNETLSTNLTITKTSNENLIVDVLDSFVLQPEQPPCQNMYSLNADEFIHDKWQLSENGLLYRFDDSRTFKSEEFCFAHDSDTESRTMLPFICSNPNYTSRVVIYSYTLVFSIPFMIATILVYTIIPELRNLHGKSLASYLIGLVIGYSILVHFMRMSQNSEDSECPIYLVYIAYFFIMSSFFWLSVISFDLCWSIRNKSGRSKNSKRFNSYGLFAWGLAAVCLAFTYFAQISELIPNHLKPGIGNNGICWLDTTTNFSAGIYFYGPMLCVIIFNCAMYGYTSFVIYRVKEEMATMLGKGESRASYKSNRNGYCLFLKLFLIMGIAWITEIISFLCDTKYDYIFYFTDFLNMIQGLLIFIVFVVKKNVKNLILNRCGIKARPPMDSSTQNTSRSSAQVSLMTRNPASAPNT